MNKRIGLLVAGVLVGAMAAAAISGCTAREGEESESAARDQASSASGTVTLSAEQQSRVAIVTSEALAGELAQEIPALGRVLDPSAILDALNDLRATESALDAATREFERVHALRANDLNASARDLEAAAAALARDRGQRDSARNKVRSLGADVLLGARDSDRIIAALSRRDAVLIRADATGEDSMALAPVGAQIRLAADHGSPVPLRMLGDVPAEPLTSARSYLLLLMPNSLNLRPNTSVTIYLLVGSDKMHGWAVPRVSIVRTEGRAWVYLQRDATTFVRTAVNIVSSGDDTVFVSAPGDLTGAIVSAGAQTLLSEE